jgi:hypothetical protein
MSEQSFLGGKVVLRPDEGGGFDELLLMEGDECRVHMEMMDDNNLWIGIYPKGEEYGEGKNGRSFRVSIGARDKLRILAEED